jgi:site-specific recombinase XerD
MKTDRITALEEGSSAGLDNSHISSFLTHLRTEGYAERTLRKKKSVIASFARWAAGKQLALADLSESILTTFVERFPERSKSSVNFELAALQPFLTHLRAEAGVQARALPINASPEDELKQCYIDYLRKERGLTEYSVRVYLPLVSDFLSEQAAKSDLASPDGFDAQAIQDFLLDHTRNRSSEYSRLLVTALRSFLRFLYLREKTTIDLSLAIPTIRRWRQADVPGLLSPDEVDRILLGTDLSSARGRRDHAILLLLARLGLRAGEIVNLELEDILWRSAEIVIRGKGRVRDRLPLLSEIGEALALYLTQDRGTSKARRVFLRMWAPRVGLTGPAAVGHIVRQALARVGLRAPSRGAAHLFRHSLATTMIRNGASIAEISEILRHRSQSSTQIYAKVDFEALREVARPWPGEGGE